MILRIEYHHCGYLEWSSNALSVSNTINTAGLALAPYLEEKDKVCGRVCYQRPVWWQFLLGRTHDWFFSTAVKTHPRSYPVKTGVPSHWFYQSQPIWTRSWSPSDHYSGWMQLGWGRDRQPSGSWPMINQASLLPAYCHLWCDLTRLDLDFMDPQASTTPIIDDHQPKWIDR